MDKQPRLRSAEANKELDKVAGQFEKIEQGISAMAKEDITKIPRQESESQTKLSKKEIDRFDAPVIKYVKAFAPAKKSVLPDKWKAQRDHDWELVKVICENKEIIGESIELWNHKWPGDLWTFWVIPTNTPVYIPRTVAKQIHECHYLRRVMKDKAETWFDEGVGLGAAQTIKVNRLECTAAGGGF